MEEIPSDAFCHSYSDRTLSLASGWKGFIIYIDVKSSRLVDCSHKAQKIVMPVPCTSFFREYTSLYLAFLRGTPFFGFWLL